MDLDAEMRRKIAASVAAVGLFIVLVLYVGATFNDGGLSSDGGLALVGVIALFVLVMAGVGLFLSRS